MSESVEKSTEKTEESSFSRLLPLTGLAGLLISSEVVYLALLQLDAINGWQPVLTFWIEMAALFVFYFLAAVLVARCESIKKFALWLIIFGAVLFRVTLLPAGIPFEYSPSEKLEAVRSDVLGKEVAYDRFLLFDNDVWRYVWDGHVTANGVNPYRYAPTDPHLDVFGGESVEFDETDEFDELSDEASSNAAGESRNEATDGLDIWRDIRDNVNHADVTTIYPPLAQFVFWLAHAIAPGSIFVMKAFLVLCELIGILFLALTLRRLGLAVTSVILYAWNPLMIKVFAGSGHADAILVAAICAAVYFIVCGWKSIGAAAFGLAILAKLSPVILVPFVVRRVGWRRSLIVPGVVLIGYLPFIDAGQNLFSGFLKFAREWQFNAGPFALIRWLSEFVTDDSASMARMICGVLIFAIVAFLAWRDDLSDGYFVSSSAIALGAAIILSPTVMPWYLSWVLPLAVMARQFVWVYFTAIVLAAFHIMIDLNEYAYVLWLEYSLFFALVGLGHRFARR